MSELVGSLRAITGADGVLTVADDITAYRGDLAYPSGGEVLCVVRPRTVEETSQIVRTCASAGAAITPRGGGTGLSGGATPAPGRSTAVVSFERMRRIRSVHPIDSVMIVEAGCTLREAQEAAANAGRLLGLDHGGASSQIGGNLSTNAGGNNVLRYGMARDQVLGLEVVLASGEVLSQLSVLRKNNTGYDLKQIFLGAEGTLGLITAASLRLRPAPVVRATACLGLPSLEAVLILFAQAQARLGDAINAFEVMPCEGLEFHFAHSCQRRAPFVTMTPWVVLLEADSASSYFDLNLAFEELVAAATGDGTVIDGTIAASEAQRAALWRLREGIPIAMIETPGALKSDTAVPIAAIPEFIKRARAAVNLVVPGCRPIPFGHVGDGNIHFNVLPPAGANAQTFAARWGELTRAIEDVALTLGGTVSAEHGIGLMKRDGFRRMRSQAERDAMKALKETFDPRNIFNPGKIF